MRSDFGEFLLPEAPNEDEIMRSLVAQASANPKLPGKAWVRVIEGTVKQLGYVLEGYRMLHVDLDAGLLVAEEEWGGVIYARRTRRLGRV